MSDQPHGLQKCNHSTFQIHGKNACPACWQDLKNERDELQSQLAAAMSGHELAVAAGREWQKKAEQFEVLYRRDGDSQRPLMNMNAQLAKDRDEWKRRAEEWAAKLQLVKESVQGVCAERDKWKEMHTEGLQSLARTICEQRDAAALQNRELRKALESIVGPADGETLNYAFSGEVAEAQKALALTPTQAEKIVEAIELVCAKALWACEASNITGDLRDAIGRLEATRKGEA